MFCLLSAAQLKLWISLSWIIWNMQLATASIYRPLSFTIWPQTLTKHCNGVISNLQLLIKSKSNLYKTNLEVMTYHWKLEKPLKYIQKVFESVIFSFKATLISISTVHFCCLPSHCSYQCVQLTFCFYNILRLTEFDDSFCLQQCR